VEKRLERFFCTAIFLILCLVVLPLNAATTGKIAGKVVDKETGEPLPGTNIIVVGTNFVAAADVNGEFFIINLPPGSYDVQARMMGYAPVKMENVRVRTNSTTTTNFELPMTVIEGEEVVVTVDAIANVKDQTSSIRNVSSEQISVLPVESTSQIVELQAGVVDGHFRGGRSNEVSYMIDGLTVNDAFNKGRMADVETEVIEDVEVILGTFNAEYGRAMSGVVNAVTKEGGSKLEGFVSGQFGNYLTTHDDLFIGLDPAEMTRKTNWRTQLSGPIIKNKLSFLINYRYRDEANHLNGIHRFNPDDYSNFSSPNPDEWYSEHSGDNSYVPMGTYIGHSIYGKLTLKPFANFKTSLIANIGMGERGSYSHNMKYNPYGRSKSHWDNRSFSLLVNHTISKRIFHELKLSYLDNTSERYLFEDPFDSRYVSEWYGLESLPGFSTGGQDKGHNRTSTRKMDVKYDITWQATNHHSLKAGALLTMHEKDINNRTIVNVFRNNDELDRFRDTTYTLEGDIEKISYPFFEPTILDDSTTYSEIYNKKPCEFSAYLQDKMEFDDLVMNFGVRYDWFDPNTLYPTNLRNPANQLLYPDNPERMSDYLEADPQSQISPRFGLAYTLSDQAKLHFSYGHFFQMPDAYALYSNHSFRIAAGNFSTTNGNPLLEPEKSVKYEVGLWQQIAKGVGLNVALYYADVYHLLSTMVMTTYNEIKYGLYTNKDYGNRKGLEVGLDGSVGDWFMNLNYTLQYTRGNADNPTQTFTRAGNNMDPIPRLITMSWDQRHTLNTSVGYQKKRFNATITAYYNSGKPYTWSPIPESRLAFVNLYPNNAWKPSGFSADFRGHYDFPIGKNNLRVQLLIYNLFDAQIEYGVNSTTGRANQAIVRESDLARHRSDFNDYNDRIVNPANISAPREVKLSLGFYF